MTNIADTDTDTDTVEFSWTQKHPTYPAGDVRNDETRNALDAIARKAVGYFEQGYAYYSDLLWDAQRAALMEDGETNFIVVRSMGTSWFEPVHQTPESIADKLREAKAQAEEVSRRDYPAAVLRIQKQKHTLSCTAVHEATTRA